MQKIYFENPTRDEFLKIVQPHWKDTEFSTYLIGRNSLATEIAGVAKQKGVVLQQCADMSIVSEQQVQAKEKRLVIVTEQSGENLSAELLCCLDIDNIVIVAPITDWHFSQKPLFLVAIPKSGTHLVFELIKALGYYEGIEAPDTPCGQTWYCIEYSNPHTVARDFFVDTVRRMPFGNRLHRFMHSPTLFMYRHPLDILVSEANYYHKDGKTTFAGWLDGLDFNERVVRLLNDNWLLGSLRDRIGGFLPWLDFPNVISISFEELIGVAGGGKEKEQLQLIWSILLKLQVPGDPNEISKHLFNPNADTFNSGQSGDYKNKLSSQVICNFNSQNEDILIQLGYSLDGSVSLPMNSEVRRNRRIQFSKANYEKMPISLESDFLGCNLIRYAQNIYAIPLAAGSVIFGDLPTDVIAEIPVANSLINIKAILLNHSVDPLLYQKLLDRVTKAIKIIDLSWIVTENIPQLLQTNYSGFNLVAYAGQLWAAKVSAGELDFTKDTDKIIAWLADGRLLKAATIPELRVAVDKQSKKTALPVTK